MSTRVSRRPLKRQARDTLRRKPVLNMELDLNVVDLEFFEEPPEGIIAASGGLPSSSHVGAADAPIDVDAIADNSHPFSISTVAEDSWNWSTSLLQNNGVCLVDLEAQLPPPESVISRLPIFTSRHCQKAAPKRVVIDCEKYVDLESDYAGKKKGVATPPPPPPPPPKEPTFSCPICMGQLVEAMSTVCGHIFCKQCITAAIKVRKSCPTCRRKLTQNNIHRVYLPTAN
ncbi:hypothetical protein QJS04_geneDACA020785 [Acorus gramineus]|uniref:RING-type domain-containing protein n=1 Tax=Acorus gramineus TaxID=55184 RepID=A0AAV9A640_ACOGR|nr:hypothetical protein QJS04_geneDACA020785 [Acorus gramineus]